MRIGIIGTAGRGETIKSLSKTLYLRALQKLNELVADIPIIDRLYVSGGAAWMDHLAITSWRRDLCAGLELHLPAPWDSNAKEFLQVTTSTFDAGKIANHYHHQFSNKIGTSTLASIEEAMKKGCSYHDHYGGFKERNLEVGKVDRLYAFTFGPDQVPAVGGTSHCWHNSSAKIKIHIPLHSLSS